jgi:flagellar protein FlgJ
MSDSNVNKSSSTPGFYADFADFASLRGKSAQDPDGALREVAEQFEALFVAQMLKAMRDTIPKDGLFSSSEMGTYQQMLDQQLALDLSKSGSIGLADLIEQQLRPQGLGSVPDAAPAAVEPPPQEQTES